MDVMLRINIDFLYAEGHFWYNDLNRGLWFPGQGIYRIRLRCIVDVALSGIHRKD